MAKDAFITVILSDEKVPVPAGGAQVFSVSGPIVRPDMVYEEVCDALREAVRVRKGDEA